MILYHESLGLKLVYKSNAISIKISIEIYSRPDRKTLKVAKKVKDNPARYYNTICKIAIKSVLELCILADD